MNLERVQRNMLILLVVGLVALGVMVTRVDHELTDLTHTLLKISEDVRATKPSGAAKPDADSVVMKGDSAKVVSVQALKVGDKTYVFRHHCSGDLDIAPHQTLPFCVGDNQLTVTAGTGKPTVLNSSSASSAQAAPVMRPVTFVPSTTGAGAILLSYGPDTCVTTDDCGVGQDYNHVTYEYAAGDTDMPVRPLSHYPGRGWAQWNPSGTRAVFIPDTCGGGAGCGVETLTGYDLAADVVQPASTEKAAGSDSGGQLADETGKRLPNWGSVTWKNDDEFTATIFDAKGKSKTIDGKF